MGETYLPLILAGGGITQGYQGKLLEDLVKRAEKIYVETYTVPGSQWLLDWAKKIGGNKVVIAERRNLEDESDKIINESTNKLVVILVPGDPMIATTHKALLAEAKKKGVQAMVIPGVSGVCASISLSMLDSYKYGRIITVPGPWRGVKAYSIIYYLLTNSCAGLHTLVLLDFYDTRVLTPKDAAGILIELGKEIGIEDISNWPVILISKAGYIDGYTRLYLKLSELAKDEDAVEIPSSIAIPGELSSVEREILEAYYGIDPGPGPEKMESCKLVAKLSKTL